MYISISRGYTLAYMLSSYPIHYWVAGPLNTSKWLATNGDISKWPMRPKRGWCSTDAHFFCYNNMLISTYEVSSDLEFSRLWNGTIPWFSLQSVFRTSFSPIEGNWLKSVHFPMHQDWRLILFLRDTLPSQSLYTIACLCKYYNCKTTMQNVLRIQDTTYHPTYFTQQKINKLSNIA